MLRTLAIFSAAGLAAAGSVELVGGIDGGVSIDNVKGSWSHDVTIFGKMGTLTANYDRSENENFPTELTFEGTAGNVDYKLTNSFSSSTDFKVSSTTNDGSTIGAEGACAGLASGMGTALSKISASKAVSVRDYDCELELSHDLDSSESKIKLSSVLGGGVTATATVTARGNSASTEYEAEYETELRPGTTLTATVSPEGKGEIELVDTATFDAEVTASLPLGGSPTLSVSKTFDF